MQPDRTFPAATATSYPSATCLLLAAAALAGCGGGGGGGGGGGDPLPTATADSYLVAQPLGTLNVSSPGVLLNDVGTSLSAALTNNPSCGNLSLNPDGSFTYTQITTSGPCATADSFTYRANNGSGSSTPATVTLAINQPPVASNDCMNTAWDTPVDIDLKALVSDPDGPAAPGGFAIFAQGSKGTTTVLADGTARYSPNSTLVAGADSFTFRYTDPMGGPPVDGQVKVAIGNRIMPLGDSISAGVFDDTANPTGTQRVGYRRKLYGELTANGKNVVDFVGQYIEGENASPAIGDPHHEGRLGLTDDQLAAQVISRLNGTLNDRNNGCPTSTSPCVNQLGNGDPDIVLLHIGTNGIDGSDNNASAADVENTIDNIRIWENLNRPVTVLLARIISSPTPAFAANANTRNNAVEAMVRGRADFGGELGVDTLDTSKRLFLVDMQASAPNGAGLSYVLDTTNPYTSGDMFDNLHPNPAGYDKIADAWRNALVNIGSVCP